MPTEPLLTVIIPTHNPHAGRLRRTLAGLRTQTLSASRWETLLVNNASTEFPEESFFAECGLSNLTVVAEPVLGLTSARRRGLASAAGRFAVLVDDDNVLDPSYLETVVALFESHPEVGTLGGISRPEFDATPPEWTREFFPLLALRDLGPTPIVESLETSSNQPTKAAYPKCSPIGAGMALRRTAWEAWMTKWLNDQSLSDRHGSALTSGGDNDIVLTALNAGWKTGYFPELGLTHLIPPGRLTKDYLARLNRGIQKSWMQVLYRHRVNPWPGLTSQGASLRKAKAFLTYTAWTSPAAWIRWHGACGHFEGRVIAKTP